MKNLSLVQAVEFCLRHAGDRIATGKPVRTCHIIRCDENLYSVEVVNISTLTPLQLAYHQGTMLGNMLSLDFFLNLELQANYDLHKEEIEAAIKQFNLINPAYAKGDLSKFSSSSKKASLIYGKR